MARRAVNADGLIELVELRPEELAKLLDVTTDKLEAWRALVPVETDEAGLPVYRFSKQSQLRLVRQRVAVLKTRMSVEAVRNVEADDKLAAYAALAVDCPEGITAHVYRSFLVLILVQQKTGLMLDAEGLALRANLLEIDPASGNPRPSPSLARKHLRLLQAIGLLRHGGERWEFARIPACLSKSQ